MGWPRRHVLSRKTKTCENTPAKTSQQTLWGHQEKREWVCDGRQAPRVANLGLDDDVEVLKEGLAVCQLLDAVLLAIVDKVDADRALVVDVGVGGPHAVLGGARLEQAVDVDGDVDADLGRVADLEGVGPPALEDGDQPDQALLGGT